MLSWNGENSCVNWCLALMSNMSTLPHVTELVEKTLVLIDVLPLCQTWVPCLISQELVEVKSYSIVGRILIFGGPYGLPELGVFA
jgi:hypothetical protein